MYQNSRFDFQNQNMDMTKTNRLLITRLGLGAPPCSQFHLQGLQTYMGLPRRVLAPWQGVGVRSAAQPLPWPPPPPAARGLWSSGFPLLLAHQWPPSQNVCYSISTMIYCYLPFYSPPFLFLFSFFCCKGDKKGILGLKHPPATILPAWSIWGYTGLLSNGQWYPLKHLVHF